MQERGVGRPSGKNLREKEGGHAFPILPPHQGKMKSPRVKPDFKTFLSLLVETGGRIEVIMGCERGGWEEGRETYCFVGRVVGRGVGDESFWL